MHVYLKANWLCCDQATRSDGGRKEVVRQRKVNCGRLAGAAETRMIALSLLCRGSAHGHRPIQQQVFRLSNSDAPFFAANALQRGAEFLLSAYRSWLSLSSSPLKFLRQ